jgi:hypothetical protein
MLEPHLFDACAILRVWAENNGFVRRLWVYGSRLRGTQRSDSDLDVAIEIDLVGTDQTASGSWIPNSAIWKTELQAQLQCLQYTLDLQLYDGSIPGSKMVQYINCCSTLVYERPR